MDNGMVSVFQKAKENSLKYNYEKPGDFYKDGLLHCGKCGGKKQHAVNIPNAGMYNEIVGCMCYCRQAELRDAQAKERKLEHDRYVRELNRECFDSPFFTAMTFAASDNRDEPLRICEEWAQTYQQHRGNGIGLMLYGGVGTGKTYLAAATCNALMAQGVACKMINFPDLANEVNGSYNKASVLNGLDNYEVLVIDDLGVERDTAYMGEIVESVIDRRYRIKFPIIVTTNLTPDEMDSPTSVQRERLFSRLAEMTIPVNVAGADRRKK